jgi:hypothetical protein
MLPAGTPLEPQIRQSKKHDNRNNDVCSLALARRLKKLGSKAGELILVAEGGIEPPTYGL